MTPEMVVPVIANIQLAGKFLRIPVMPPVEERIATLALIYGAGAAITKVGDVPCCWCNDISTYAIYGILRAKSGYG